MKVLIKKDSDSMGKTAAEMIAEEIKRNPNMAIAFPTGSTPLKCYEHLVKMYQEDSLDFSGVLGFNMDEYVPLTREHPQSYYYFMRKYLYDQVNFQEENMYVPDAAAEDLDKACEEYTDKIIEKGYFDLILLGIGRDGHIAFNMPGDKSRVFAYVEQLSEKTIKDNSRFFGPDEEVPDRAITLGMNIILNSKKIILIADGEGKSEAVGRFLNNWEITPKLPASFLWIHPDVTVILDEKAAAQIDLQTHLFVAGNRSR